MKKVVCFLPVRGIEDDLNNKNLQIFSGEPLYLFTLRKLLDCDFIDEVYVDSNDVDILKVSKLVGAEVIHRPEKLASKKVDGHELFSFEVSNVKADIYIQILCTSPFIEMETIRKSIEIVKDDSNEFDSVILCKKEPLYHWVNNKPLYGNGDIPNREDLDNIVTESMGLYTVKAKQDTQILKRIGDKPFLLPGKPIEQININSLEELNLAEYVSKGIKSEEIKYLNLLKTVISSPILSDICDEMGLDCVLPAKFYSNIPRVKMFGRARTLKLRQSNEHDSENAIYDALKSYEYVVENDIIVVGTDCPELAYFGDLNMSLAIRAGASGALIGGVTRDTSRTFSAGFPVFAHGKYCKDIKGKGAVEGINIPLKLDGINIDFGDLVFGDDDGIIVIPRRHEKDILERAVKLISNESKIISSILNKTSTLGLVEKHGFF